MLILTTFDLDEYVFDASKAGASGFLLKDATGERHVGGVRLVAGGSMLLLARSRSNREISSALFIGVETALRPWFLPLRTD